VKVPALGILAVAAALAGAAFVASRRDPAPKSPKAVEKVLSSAARRGAQSANECDAFFADWEESIKGAPPFDTRKIARLSDQLARYPGIPSATSKAWKVLALELPSDGDVDLSFAFGLSDCHYAKFVRLAGRILADVSKENRKNAEADRLARGVLAILREVMEKPLSRQALLESVTLVRRMSASGWLQWGAADGVTWDRTYDSLRQLNSRAEAREGELTQKVFKAASFKDIAPGDRKAILSQVRYCFLQTEKTRLALQPFLARVRLLPAQSVARQN
jgi:hypothetical protein